MDIYQRAETVICTASVTNTDDEPTDPGTSLVITVTNPDGTVVVDAGNMLAHKDATGEYHYDYTPAADATLGIYNVRVTAVHSSRTTIQDDVFRLV